PRRVERVEAGLVDVDAGVRDPRLDHALFGERLAEGGARLRAAAQHVEGALGGADGAHAVMDAARTEAGLRHREPAALLTEDVRLRYAHVLEEQLAVTFRVLV